MALKRNVSLAAGLRAHGGGYDRRTRGRVAGIIEIGVVERVEHLHAELHLEAFRQVEVLRYAQIEVVVGLGGKRVSWHSGGTQFGIPECAGVLEEGAGLP